MKTACLIGGPGISRHGGQQCQPSKSAFQHHEHSRWNPNGNSRGNAEFPAHAANWVHAGHWPGSGAGVFPLRYDGQTLPPFRNETECPASAVTLHAPPRYLRRTTSGWIVPFGWASVSANRSKRPVIQGENSEIQG
jgi:hypothetical protein